MSNKKSTLNDTSWGDKGDHLKKLDVPRERRQVAGELAFPSPGKKEDKPSLIDLLLNSPWTQLPLRLLFGLRPIDRDIEHHYRKGDSELVIKDAKVSRRGGKGNDEYNYHLGDGMDVIEDSEGNNSLILHDIDLSQVRLSQDEKDLKISFPDHPGSGITWKNFYGNTNALRKIVIATTAKNGNAAT